MAEDVKKGACYKQFRRSTADCAIPTDSALAIGKAGARHMNNLSLSFAMVKNLFPQKVVIDSLKIGLFVGLILNLINHGGALLDNADISWGRVLLNFIIPFCVSAFSGVRAIYTTCRTPVRNSLQATSDRESTVS